MCSSEEFKVGIEKSTCSVTAFKYGLLAIAIYSDFGHEIRIIRTTDNAKKYVRWFFVACARQEKTEEDTFIFLSIANVYVQISVSLSDIEGATQWYWCRLIHMCQANVMRMPVHARANVWMCALYGSTLQIRCTKKRWKSAMNKSFRFTS